MVEFAGKRIGLAGKAGSQRIGSASLSEGSERVGRPTDRRREFVDGGRMGGGSFGQIMVVALVLLSFDATLSIVLQTSERHNAPAFVGWCPARRRRRHACSEQGGRSEGDGDRKAIAKMTRVQADRNVARTVSNHALCVNHCMNVRGRKPTAGYKLGCHAVETHASQQLFKNHKFPSRA